MGVTENFKNFVGNLRTTNDSIISVRRKNIVKRINMDFRGSYSDTDYSRFVGSYGRGTAIKGFSDVDLMVILPYSVYDKYNNYLTNGQSALLQAVKNSISQTYSQTKTGGDGQVVVVEFSDGIIFEVLPAFYNSTDDYYVYPDSHGGGSWKTCKPIHEIKAINEQNILYNKKVKHLVRMMKAWKKKNNVPISGLLIETLAMNFMKDWTNNDKSYLFYDYMVRDFLNYLSQQDTSKNYWLAWGSKQFVYRKGIFEYKAKRSFNIALEAIEAEEKKYTYTARSKWQEIFGTYYEG